MLWRLKPLPPGVLIDLGAAAVFASGVGYVIQTRDRVGEVSADIVGSTLWPHWVAAGGLVLAVGGALIRANGLPAPLDPRLDQLPPSAAPEEP